MKHLVLLLFMSLCSTTYILAQNKIDFGVGPTLAFTKPIVFGLQAKAAYHVTERFHPSFTYTYYIRENVNFAVDLDARFFLFSVEEYQVSPLAGINLTRLGKTRTSVNLGLFLEIERDWFSLYLEPKVVLDDRTFFVMSGGLYF